MLKLCSLPIAFLLLVSASGTFGAEPKLLSNNATADTADRAIVFIHGLLGSAEASFESWPAIIARDGTELPDHGKLSDFAVYSVNYEADFRSQAKLDEIAVGVARDLAASQIFRRHRHVWLVAHSMGGLVLKRTLTLWRQERKELLIGRILAVGLLGVPSAGSPLADLAKEYGVGSLAKTFGWNGELLKDLTTNSGSYLISLETSWEGLKRARDTELQRRFTPIIYCGYEEKPEVSDATVLWKRMLGYGVNSIIDTTVVPRLFSSTACDERRGFSVRHTDLIKPKNASDSVHVWLRNLINISITQGMHESRVELGTRPPSPRANVTSASIDFNMYDRVKKINLGLEPRNLDLQTGLPINPERIIFSDNSSEARAKSLVLRSGPFVGSTLLSAWQLAASENTCLKVGNSINRLTIILTIGSATVQCTGGARVCAGQSCD